MTQSFADPGIDPTANDVTRNANVNLTANTSGYSQEMTQAGRQTAVLSGAVDTLSSKLDGLSKRAGRKLELFAGADFAALGGATATAVSFEKQLSTLAATASVTGVSMRGLKGDVEGAFTHFPIARSQVVGLVEDISSLGVTAPRDIGKLTDTIIRLGAATGEPIQGLAAGLIQLSRLMGVTGAGPISNYANSLLVVSKNAGVSATGVLNFAQSIAPIARQAGLGEAAVLGISAAFSKAGADGYVAANTFNTIVNDITQLSRSGSPELAKYATAVGLTVSQFRQLSGQQQATTVFDAIAKGGSKSLALVNELGLGIRGLSAVQAVSQSGGIDAAIQQAVGASTNQNALNKGSNAALSGVADQLERIRNEITQAGTEIGTTFLRPLRDVLSVMVSIGHAVNAIIKPLAPILGPLALVGGIAGAAAGVGLAHIGLLGTAASVRLLASPNSIPRTALREGRQVGAAERASLAAGTGALSIEEISALNGSAARYNGAGRFPLRARVPFAVGRLAARSGTSIPSLGNPFGRIGGVAEDAAVVAEETAAAGGPSVGRQVGRAGLLGIIPRTVSYFARSQTNTMRASRAAGYDRLPPEGDGVKGFVSSNAENTAAQGSLRALASAAAGAAKSVGIMAVETGRAGVSAAGAALGSTAAGRVARSGLGLIGRGVGAVAGSLVSPLGLVTAASVAVPAIISSLSAKATAGNNPSLYLNPIQQYNNQLGIATTKLADFNSGLGSATSALSSSNGISSSTPLNIAAQVTSTDTLTAKQGSNKDQNLAAIANGVRSGPTAIARLTQLAQTYDFSDARQVQLFKTNALAAGFDADSVQKALSAAVTPTKSGAQGPLDFSALASRVTGSEGVSTGILSPFGISTNPSKSGQALRGSVFTKLQNQYGSDVTTGGQGYAAGREFSGELGYLSSLLGSGITKSDPGAKELGNTFKEFFGGSSKKYDLALGPESQYAGTDFSKMTDAQRQAILLKVIGGQSAGAGVLSSLGGLGVNVNRAGSYQGLYGKGATDPTIQALQAQGPLGKFLTTSPIVQKEVNTGQIASDITNPVALLQSSGALYAAGLKSLGGNTDAVVAKFAMLEASAGDLSSGLGLAAASAEAYSRQQQTYQTPYLSREGQLGQSASNVVGSSAALKAAGPNASQGLVDQFTSDTQAYEQQKASYQQYLISTYQQLTAFQVQSSRASEDYNTQTGRQQQAFQIQQTQSLQDYLKSRYRTQRDYDTQLRNETQTAAQTIYDPFAQIQSKYTLDAASTILNLKNQNSKLGQQGQELGQLSKLGVSTQTIQELDLANPGNAQQLDSLVQSILADPKLAAQLNAEIAKRLKATSTLVQSKYSLQFVQSQQAFQVQLHDTATDFATAQGRAVQAQDIALGQMAHDYGVMVSRSAQDLDTAMTQLFGSFGDQYSKTVGKISSALGSVDPQLAKLLKGQLHAAGSVVNQAEQAVIQGAIATVAHALQAASNDTTIEAAMKANPKLSPLLLGLLSANALASQAGITVNQSGISLAIPGLSGPPPKKPTATTPPPKKPTPTPHAAGAIALSPQMGVWGEAGPEALIPLDTRGENFMAGTIARALAQHITIPTGNSGASRHYVHEDHSTEYSGPITVMADDPRAMERQLTQRKRVTQLVRPGQH